MQEADEAEEEGNWGNNIGWENPLHYDRRNPIFFLRKSTPLWPKVSSLIDIYGIVIQNLCRTENKQQQKFARFVLLDNSIFSGRRIRIHNLILGDSP